MNIYSYVICKLDRDKYTKYTIQNTKRVGIVLKFLPKVAALGSELLLHLEAHNSTLKRASWDLTVPGMHNCIKVTCKSNEIIVS